MSTRQVLGAVGAAVGAYFGGPAGAQWGWAIGNAIGTAIDPDTVRGPSIGDVGAQTSQEGVPRPIVFALSPPIAGNIIASSEPDIVRRRKRDGFLGPKIVTEHVYRTYAIGVCEGPITRFVRVWRNNKLIFDVSENPLVSSQENAEWLSGGRLYLGSWNQGADPGLETHFGVGTTPAHRGTAYMVRHDEELTDLRGAVPQYVFQVERCNGYYITSRPYPIEDSAALSIGAAVIGGRQTTDPIESVSIGLSVLGGTLSGGVQALQAESEAIDIGMSVLGGSISGGAVAYTSGVPEAVDIGLEVLGGELYGSAVSYSNGEPEAVDVGLSVIGGTLS